MVKLTDLLCPPPDSLIAFVDELSAEEAVEKMDLRSKENKIILISLIEARNCISVFNCCSFSVQTMKPLALTCLVVFFTILKDILK